MTLRLRCGCGRNLLDATSGGDGRTLSVAARPGVTDRVEGGTHNVACLCGQSWPLPEWKMRNWWRQRMFTEDGDAYRVAGIVYAVLGRDV